MTSQNNPRPGQSNADDDIWPGEDGAPATEFARLLAATEQKSLAEEGAVVRGRVVAVHSNEVLIDIGYKSEGVVDIREFTDAQGNVNVKPGDEVDVLFEKKENQDGYVVLSKQKAVQMKVWLEVENAYRDGKPIKGRVVERIKGGLVVDIGINAFLPGSQADIRPVRNLESLIGQELEVKVIKVNKKRGNIVLSRKQLLEEQTSAAREKTLETLEDGARMAGVVKNITDYGAFIDLGGIDGLLHITDMSWGRVSNPGDLFQVGQEVNVIVLKYDRENQKVSLGYKQRSDDPWITAAERFPSQARVQGKVVSLTDYGAFVELEEGVEGLIHVSEMSWTKRLKHPSKVLQPGQDVECVVLDIDQAARRISLGLKQTEPNPWSVIAERYQVGSRVTGKVRNLTDFGAFVEIEEGVDGLVHISDMSWTKRIKHPSELLKKGQEVEVQILNIDVENQRLSLGIKQTQPDVWEGFFNAVGIGDTVLGKVVRIVDYGAFVELQEGVEGFVHVSEIADERIDHPKDRLAEGMELPMKIVRMDIPERKVGLSIKAYHRSEIDQNLHQLMGESRGGFTSLGEVSEFGREKGRRKKGRKDHEEGEDED